MVAYLARCQLEPSMPRCSIETLLHAFVPAAHVDHTHPDAINAIAGAVDGEALAHACFGDEVAWIDYIRPGFTLARQVGEAIRADDRVRIVILAKHGLVTWGDSAHESYRATIDAINRAADFVNERTNGSARFGGARERALLDDAAPRGAARAAAAGAARGGEQRALQGAARRQVAARPRARCDSERAPRARERRRAVPRPPGAHQARAAMGALRPRPRRRRARLAERIAAGAVAYREDYRAYVERFGDAATVAGRPRPARRARAARRPRGLRAHVKAARLSRDLYLRAIEVMAGADALGGFVSLTAQESFAIEYWPLELYKLSLAPPPGELQGKVAMVTGAAGGIGRAIVDVAQRRGRVRGRASTSTATAPATPSPRWASAGSAVAGDVTSEEAVAGAFAAAVERFGGVDIVVSNAGLASSAPIQEHDARGVEPQPRGARHRLLPGRPRGLQGPRAPGHRRLDRLRGVQERAGGRAQRRRLLVGQGGRAAPRALPGRGGRAAGIRVNTVNPDAVLRARGSGTRRGARSAPPTTASPPTSSRSTTARARRSA